MGAIITHRTLFLRFLRHTIDVIVLPFAAMHFKYEVHSVYKTQKPITLKIRNFKR